jgi:hypothetical protein
MQKYIVNNNRPNQIATVHLSSCSHLGEEPLMNSPSATRTEFDDGIEALALALEAKNFVFCGHCLNKYGALFAALRRSGI